MTYTCSGSFCENFDPFTLEWFMSNADAASIGLGGYPMTITGTTGDKSVSYDFNVLFADACTAIQTISPYESLQDQAYTVTDAEKKYYFSPFESMTLNGAVNCDLTYDFSVEPAGAESLVTFDSERRTFLFYHDSSLSVVGDYTVTVTATYSEKKQGSSSFKLTVGDPCVDENFVNLVPQDIPAVDHVPENPENPQRWNIPDFLVVTEPIDHQLCGDVEYTLVTTDLGNFLGFDPVSYEFSLDLSDGDYSGYSADYTIHGQLASYPDVSVEAIGSVLIGDPCFAFATLSVKDQPYVPEYVFVHDIAMEFDELFDITIKHCPVAFECEKITTDNGVNNMRCDDGHMIWDEAEMTWYFRGDLETE